MTQIHAFSPLRKQPGYPTTSVKLTIGDVRYDLFLPEEVSDELLVHFVGSEDSYRQVSRYCNAEGIDAIRARPSLLDHEFIDKPTFAITFYGDEDAEGDDAMNDRVALRLAVGPYAARQLYNRACRRESITEGLADFIVNHDAYFKQCGGLELLRLRCHSFDFEDLSPLMTDVDADEHPSVLLKEPKTTKTRFSDMEISR